MKRYFTRRKVMFGVGGLALMASLGNVLPLHAQDLDKVTLSYSSSAPGPESTFLFAGQQLGYFKDEGIELDIQYAGGAVAAAGFIASGTADIAMGGVEAVPSYIEKNVDMTVPYVYGYKPLFALAFLEGSQFREPKQLKGAKIGVAGLGSGSIAVLAYILEEAGLKIDDVQLIPIGVGPSALVAVTGGNVDAIMYHKGGLVELEAKGVKLTRFENATLENAYPGQGFVALKSTLQAKRDVMERLLRAVTRSLKYSIAHPAEATQGFGKLHPEIARDLPAMEASWREQIKVLTPPAWTNGQWGVMNEEGWNNYLDVLTLGKLMATRPALDALYDQEFLAAANKDAGK